MGAKAIEQGQMLLEKWRGNGYSEKSDISIQIVSDLDRFLLMSRMCLESLDVKGVRVLSDNGTCIYIGDVGSYFGQIQEEALNESDHFIVSDCTNIGAQLCSNWIGMRPWYEFFVTLDIKNLRDTPASE